MGLWDKLKTLGKKDVKEVPGVNRVLAGGAAVAGAGLVLAGSLKRGAHHGIMALQAHNSVLFLIITIFVHMLHTLLRSGPVFGPGDYLFWTYILGLPLLASFLFYKDPDEPFPIRNIIKFMILSAVAYYLPVGLTEALNRGWIPETLASLLLFFAPLWPVYIFLNPGESRITRILASLFFLGWTIIIIVLTVETQLGPVDIQKQLIGRDSLKLSFATVATSVKDIFTNTKTGVVNSTRSGFNASMHGATQEYYQGSVDQSQGQPSGVSITDTRALLSRFDATIDDITVFATMKAKTFSDSITVKNGCYLELQGASSYTQLQSTNVTGRVVPANVRVDYTGAFQDTFDLECTVYQRDYGNKVTSSSASALLVFNSTFPFETWGYVPYSFIDKDLGVSLRRANKDPAREIGVQQRPVAKYTPGPVKIGMATDSQPYFYSEPSVADKASLDPARSEAALPAFGLTISNEWQGKGIITEIHDVKVYIPEPFQLNMDTCSPLKSDEHRGEPGYENVKTWITRELNNWVENPQYKEYTITGLEVRPGETFTTFRCQLELDDYSPYKVLGISGSSIYTFFVHANYTYTLNTRTSVSIRGDPAVVQAFSQASSTANTGGLTLGTRSPNPKVNTIDQCTDATHCYNNQCSCNYDAADGKEWTCAWKQGSAAKTCWYLKPGNTIVYRCTYFNNVQTSCDDVPVGTPVNNVGSVNECTDTNCYNGACSCSYSDAARHTWRCSWNQGSAAKTCWYYVDSDTVHFCRYTAMNTQGTCEDRSVS